MNEWAKKRSIVTTLGRERGGRAVHAAAADEQQCAVRGRAVTRGKGRRTWRQAAPGSPLRGVPGAGRRAW